MGALSQMLTTAVHAIDELGQQDDRENDGYHFKADTSTWGIDDITIKAGDEEFVLAVVWKNLPNYTPSLCNLAEAFKNYGWSVMNTDKLEELEKQAEDNSYNIEKVEKSKDIIKKLCNCIRTLNNPNTELTNVDSFLEDAENFIKE